MSVEAMSYVFRSSPYLLGARLVHLAIADVVNDAYDNRFFGGHEVVAAKAGVSVRTVERSIGAMVADGYLRALTTTTAPGRAREYEFLMPGTPDNLSGEHPTSRPEHPTSTARAPLSNARDTKTDVVDDVDIGRREEVERLCGSLALAVGAFRDGAAPAVTERWRRDMRLLLERGPAGRASPTAIEPDAVERCIRFVFAELSEPEPSGFCWAAQVRSPGALRRHYDSIRVAARSRRRPASRSRVPGRRPLSSVVGGLLSNPTQREEITQ